MKKGILGVLVLALLLALSATAFAAHGPHRTETLLHYTADGVYGEKGAEYNLITVDVNDVSDHLAHGDTRFQSGFFVSPNMSSQANSGYEEYRDYWTLSGE